MMGTLQVAGFLDHSTVNGDGFRSVIFLSGCYHQCPGCHNSDMQNSTYGDTIECSELFLKIKKNAPIIDGVTLSGGEPLEQATALIPLLQAIKELGISIWLYTGYVYEELVQHPINVEVLSYIDVLVDGPFVLGLKSEHLLYKGSSNQRILKLHHGTIEKELYTTS